jgi:hypothetical protein
MIPLLVEAIKELRQELKAHLNTWIKNNLYKQKNYL